MKVKVKYLILEKEKVTTRLPTPHAKKNNAFILKCRQTRTNSEPKKPKKNTERLIQDVNKRIRNRIQRTADLADLSSGLPPIGKMPRWAPREGSKAHKYNQLEMWMWKTRLAVGKWRNEICTKKQQKKIVILKQVQIIFQATVVLVFGWACQLGSSVHLSFVYI